MALKKYIKKFDNISGMMQLKNYINLKMLVNIKKFLSKTCFDEIFSTFLVNSEIRKKIKKIKKKKKILDSKTK